MNVVVPIPDDLAARFSSEAELGRRAVEALALEQYRAGRLTRPELRQMLGFATEAELDGLLKEYRFEAVASADRDRQPETLAPSAEDKRAADDLVERSKRFRAGKTLGGLDIEELISDGRP